MKIKFMYCFEQNKLYIELSDDKKKKKIYWIILKAQAELMLVLS